MRHVAVVLAGLAVASVLAACGGDGGNGDTLTREEYQQRVADVGDTLEQTFQTLSEESDSISGGDISSGADLESFTDELAGVVGEAETSVTEAADGLAGIEPPEEAQEANDDLVEGLRTLSGDVGEIRAALEEGDLAAVLDLASRLESIETSEAGMLIQGAIEDLRSQGYDVEGAQ